MKFFSVFIFAIALVITWNLSRQEKTYAEQVHFSVQQQLKAILAESIQEQLPTVTELRFERFWTQALGEDQILAQFTYSLVDPAGATGPARLYFEGESLLYRDHSGAGDAPVFSFENISVSNSHIEFSEPLKVFSSGSEDSSWTEE